MDMDWIAIEPVHRKTVLGIHLSEERNMFVAVKKIFILSLISKYGKHAIYT
jgi:hypothetical protein